MNKKLTIAGIAVVIVFVALAVFDLNSQSTKYYVHQPVELNPDNVAAYLSMYNIVDDLPGDAEIQINFGEYKYYVSGNSVLEGDIEGADLQVWLPEEYISLIGLEGVCEAMSEANRNGEIGIEIYESEASLAWKYKGMLKYRNCFSS